MGQIRGHDFIANRQMIIAKMRKEVEENLLFANITGDVKVLKKIDPVTGTQSKSYVSSGKVVERLTDSLGLDSDHFLIPFLESLKQEPKLGDSYLTGTGERQGSKWGRAYLNQIAGVVLKKAGNMDKLRDDEVLQLYLQAEPALRDWLAKQLNAMFTSAFYEGHSFNATAGLQKSPNGIGVVGAYHPNLYYNKVNASTGEGEVTAIGTEGKNKTQTEIVAAVETDYANMTVPSVWMIDKMGELAEKLGIQKGVEYNGVKYWLSVINRSTYNMLRKDDTFRKSIREAFSTKGYEGPDFGSVIVFFGEFVFVLNNLFPRRWNATTKDFIGSNGWTGRGTDTTSKKNDIITLLGPGAFGYGVEANNNLDIIDQSQDFKQIIELAGMTIRGVNRMDVVSEADAANYFATKKTQKTILTSTYNVVNQSSLGIVVKRS